MFDSAFDEWSNDHSVYQLDWNIHSAGLSVRLFVVMCVSPIEPSRVPLRTNHTSFLSRARRECVLSAPTCRRTDIVSSPSHSVASFLRNRIRKSLRKIGKCSTNPAGRGCRRGGRTLVLARRPLLKRADPLVDGPHLLRGERLEPAPCRALAVENAAGRFFSDRPTPFPNLLCQSPGARDSPILEEMNLCATAC